MIKKFDKKDEESGSGSNPFQHLEKSAVLQEARLFNETPINPRRCLHILTKILYLLNQGEHFGTTEATEAFFAMTRLFQSNDQTLRRMCYLTIKEMANISEDVIIVTSRWDTPQNPGSASGKRDYSSRGFLKILGHPAPLKCYFVPTLGDEIHLIKWVLLCFLVS
uniref:Clathrin/coatomer adaptor adaptin-like N-terminal domain-containing protein n=1 Tax=Cyanistes caeruleus TaxID=156563 RepID=A0A8C0U7Y2_CYACU